MPIVATITIENLTALLIALAGLATAVGSLIHSIRAKASADASKTAITDLRGTADVHDGQLSDLSAKAAAALTLAQAVLPMLTGKLSSQRTNAPAAPAGIVGANVTPPFSQSSSPRV